MKRYRKLGFNVCACGPTEQFIWSSCARCGDTYTGCSAFGHTCMECFLEMVEEVNARYETDHAHGT